MFLLLIKTSTASVCATDDNAFLRQSTRAAAKGKDGPAKGKDGPSGKDSSVPYSVVEVSPLTS